MADSINIDREEAERRCERVMAIAYRGIHHVPYWRKRRWCGEIGILVSVPASLSTFDFDNLTRLVVAAHDECVRVEVVGGAPHLLKLLLNVREGRSGAVWARHDTIEEAVVKVRGYRP